MTQTDDKEGSLYQANRMAQTRASSQARRMQLHQMQRSASRKLKAGIALVTFLIMIICAWVFASHK